MLLKLLSSSRLVSESAIQAVLDVEVGHRVHRLEVAAGCAHLLEEAVGAIEQKCRLYEVTL